MSTLNQLENMVFHSHQVQVELCSSKTYYKGVRANYKFTYTDCPSGSYILMFEVDQLRMEFNYGHACTQLRLEQYYMKQWVGFNELHQNLVDSINATLKKDKNANIPVLRATILLETLPHIAKHSLQRVVRICDLQLSRLGSKNSKSFLKTNVKKAPILQEIFITEFKDHPYYTTNKNMDQAQSQSEEEDSHLEIEVDENGNKYEYQFLYIMETNQLFNDQNIIIKIGKTSKNIDDYTQSLDKRHSEKIIFNPIVWFRIPCQVGSVVDTKIHDSLRKKLPQNKIYYINEDSAKTLHREFYIMDELLMQEIKGILDQDDYRYSYQKDSSRMLSSPSSMVSRIENQESTGNSMMQKKFVPSEKIDHKKNNQTIEGKKNQKESIKIIQKKKDNTSSDEDNKSSNEDNKSLDEDYIPEQMNQGTKIKKNGQNQKNGRSQKPQHLSQASVESSSSSESIEEKRSKPIIAKREKMNREYNQNNNLQEDIQGIENISKIEKNQNDSDFISSDYLHGTIFINQEQLQSRQNGDNKQNFYQQQRIDEVSEKDAQENSMNIHKINKDNEQKSEKEQKQQLQQQQTKMIYQKRQVNKQVENDTPTPNNGLSQIDEKRGLRKQEIVIDNDKDKKKIDPLDKYKTKNQQVQQIFSNKKEYERNGQSQQANNGICDDEDQQQQQNDVNSNDIINQFLNESEERKEQKDIQNVKLSEDQQRNNDTIDNRRNIEGRKILSKEKIIQILQKVGKAEQKLDEFEQKINNLEAELKNNNIFV